MVSADLEALKAIDTKILGDAPMVKGAALHRELKTLLKEELPSTELATFTGPQMRDLLLRGIRLLRYATHLEIKAGQIKQEGLATLSMALAGSDTGYLQSILEDLFGGLPLGERGQETAAYPPSALEEEAETLAASTSTGSTTPAGKGKGVGKRSAPPPTEDPAPKKAPAATPVETEDAKKATGLIPTSEAALETFGIPPEYLPRRERGERGSSIYWCEHPECASSHDPHVVSSKPQALMHIRRQHLGLAFKCLYCEHQVWTPHAWKNHMKTRHPGVPHYPVAPKVEEAQEAPAQ